MKRNAFPFEFENEPTLADEFFKEKEMFPYEDHGGRTPEFTKWLKAKGIESSKLDSSKKAQEIIKWD